MTAFLITGFVVEVKRPNVIIVQSINEKDNYSKLMVVFKKSENLENYLHHFIEANGTIGSYKTKTFLFGTKVIDLGGVE